VSLDCVILCCACYTIFFKGAVFFRTQCSSTVNKELQGVSLTISAGSSVFVPGDWSFRILNTGTYRYTIIDVTELITCYYHLLMHTAYWVSMCDRNCIVIYTSKGNWPACFNGNMHH